MQFQVGDLVTTRFDNKVGIVTSVVENLPYGIQVKILKTKFLHYINELSIYEPRELIKINNSKLTRLFYL